MTTPEYIRAHQHASHHREEVLTSAQCGCFYCGTIFPPGEIEDWTDEWEGIGQTALCPYCGIDSVISTGSSYPITSEFLAQMHAYWFGRCHHA
jgi:hypothetical protein